MTTNISLEVLGFILTAASVVLGSVWGIFMLIRNLESKNMLIRIENLEKEIKQQAHVCETTLKELKERLAREKAELVVAEDQEHKQVADQARSLVEKTEQAIHFLEKQLDALTKRQIDDETNLATNLESIREALADIRETTAGFGKDFMTRKECLLREEKCFKEGRDKNG